MNNIKNIKKYYKAYQDIIISIFICVVFLFGDFKIRKQEQEYFDLFYNRIDETLKKALKETNNEKCKPIKPIITI